MDAYDLLDDPYTQARFWGQVAKASPWECWVWKGNISKYCYGRFFLNREQVPAHRVSWYITNGAIPDGMHVCHACDTTVCVNPHHLFLGTPQENVIDKHKKGRAKLDEAERQRAFLLWKAHQELRDEKEELISRFWLKVDKEHESGCWIWRGNLNKQGYGRFGVNRKIILAHRYSWEITNGEIPDGMYVCHICDVPACVNPSHMFLGTLADNNEDMRRKGRGINPPAKANRTSFQKGVTSGENHPRAKLTRSDIEEAKLLREQGWKYKDIAKKYGVATPTLHRAVRGTTWKKE
jgi:hypothetical protein